LVPLAELRLRVGHGHEIRALPLLLDDVAEHLLTERGGLRADARKRLADLTLRVRDAGALALWRFSGRQGCAWQLAQRDLALCSGDGRHLVFPSEAVALGEQ
jgi:hypothetical protein